MACTRNPMTGATVCTPDPIGDLSIISIVGIAFGAVALLWLVYLWLWPIYNVWRAHKEGEADLAQARNEQQIQITQAESRLKAAEFNKKAAIVEAEAVAAQIEKIGKNLKDHALYLRWQWIRMMEERHSKSDTIYVATEGGIPILEAGKRGVR